MNNEFTKDDAKMFQDILDNQKQPLRPTDSHIEYISISSLSCKVSYNIIDHTPFLISKEGGIIPLP